MKLRLALSLALCGLCITVLYFFLPNSPQSIATVKPGQNYGTTQIGGTFHLVDHRGNARSDVDFKGKILLVYFGYSFCPDICPGALYHISQALEGMGKTAEEFQPIFITVDPERDTISHLATYM